MGTTYTIKYIPASPHIDSDVLHSHIKNRLRDINSTMSTYDPNSELSLLNKNFSHECIPISEELSTVINTALEVSALTDGSFDITVGALVNLWGFGSDAVPTTIPEDTQLHTVLSDIGYEKIHLEDNNSCLRKENPELYIDLSAIAKGYAVDEVSNLLEANNISDFMVEIGGEVKAKGLNKDQVAWQIGIEKPLAEQRSVQKIIALQNFGLATSGDYRNYFEHDGKRYSHLIDATTGKPISHHVVSVTVLNTSTMLADALATALIVKGHELGLKIANENALAVLFIVKQNDKFIEIETDLFKQLTQD